MAFAREGEVRVAKIEDVAQRAGVSVATVSRALRGLPNARFLAFDSPNHNPTENDPAWPLMQREIDAFLAVYARAGG